MSDLGDVQAPGVSETAADSIRERAVDKREEKVLCVSMIFLCSTSSFITPQQMVIIPELFFPTFFPIDIVKNWAKREDGVEVMGGFALLDVIQS